MHTAASPEAACYAAPLGVCMRESVRTLIHVRACVRVCVRASTCLFRGVLRAQALVFYAYAAHNVPLIVTLSTKFTAAQRT